MSAEEKKMIGYKCKKCGKISYPKRRRCPSCWGAEFEEVELGKTAKLVTWAQYYSFPMGVRGEPPVIFGLVGFPNGVKATGRIDVEPWELKTGLTLKPVWAKLREIGEKEIFGFKFVLA